MWTRIRSSRCCCCRCRRCPPDRMGPGRSHAGQMRVDWVACERRQEAARAGDDAAAEPERYLSRAEAGKIGGGGLCPGRLRE